MSNVANVVVQSIEAQCVYVRSISRLHFYLRSLSDDAVLDASVIQELIEIFEQEFKSISLRLIGRFQKIELEFKKIDARLVKLDLYKVHVDSLIIKADYLDNENVIFLRARSTVIDKIEKPKFFWIDSVLINSIVPKKTNLNVVRYWNKSVIKSVIDVQNRVHNFMDRYTGEYKIKELKAGHGESFIFYDKTTKVWKYSSGYGDSKSISDCFKAKTDTKIFRHKLERVIAGKPLTVEKLVKTIKASKTGIIELSAYANYNSHKQIM